MITATTIITAVTIATVVENGGDASLVGVGITDSGAKLASQTLPSNEPRMAFPPSFVAKIGKAVAKSTELGNF